jgi:hypothetical protein
VKRALLSLVSEVTGEGNEGGEGTGTTACRDGGGEKFRRALIAERCSVTNGILPSPLAANSRFVSQAEWQLFEDLAR